MTLEAESEAKMEIAHVLNMDLVAYSTLLITEQTRVLAELARIVKNTPRCLRAEAEGKLIRVPTGDGMLLVFFDDPEAPIACAVEIATAIKNHPDIRLRMGLHTGPVHEVMDVNERSNVAGAGVDMAQRVMDCGDAGHILLSRNIADNLAPYPRWNAYLHEIGDCEVKHGRRLALVNFYTDHIGDPELPRKCAAKLETIARSTTAPLRQSRSWRPLFISAALVALALGLVWVWRQTRTPSRGADANAKSVAVLPFENLSRDPENAYFADGIQEEILSRLSRIADLKVISRTSSQRFKSAPTNLPEIAKQLGVAHVLEGTVQKSADQVRVNIQLINALNDSHVWADKFDRKLTDIFAVETEIATKVADVLQAKLTGRERRTIAARPTDDAEAHQLYLKGRYFWGKRTTADLEKAIEYFSQALARDANFAPAYVGLADSYVVAYAYAPERFPGVYEKALPAVERALEIDNDLAEAHASLALLRGNQGRLREALNEFERAIALNPNYATAHHWFAFSVLSPIADFDRAIAEFKRAIDLDPFSGIMHCNLAATYGLMHRYPEAFGELRMARELDPSASYVAFIEADLFEYTGQFAKAQKNCEKVYEESRNEYTAAALGRIYALHGQRTKALEMLEQMKQMAQQRYVSPAPFALIFLGLGEKEEAIKYLQQMFDQRDSGEGQFLQDVKVGPIFDPVRGDPRFDKMADEIVPPDLYHGRR
jgi:TolB-like protein/thioredoxin-like negative regulator of GroEL